jgi:phenylacetate-CoA ligase
MGAIRVLKYFLMLGREQWLGRDEIERISAKRLDAALRNARRTSHYRNLLEANGSEFPQLPLTGKDALRSDPGSFLPENADLSSLREIRTSGSTGTPLSIYIDSDAEDYRVAKEYFVECVCGRSPFEMFALFSSTPDPVHPALAQSGLFPRISLSPFVPDEENLAAIRRNKVRMLRAFPSGLRTMAGLNGRNPLGLKSILSTGEMLDEGNRRLIEDSFSCPVLDCYGMMEYRTIAYQCPEERRFHVDESSFIVEIAGADGKPKKAGRGEIVVTSLHSSPMPFIRYSTGDIGSWGKECSCGRSTRVIGSLEGRKTDVFVLPSGRIRPFGVLYAALNQARVKAFQIVQEKPDLFVFRYVPLGKELPAVGRKEIENRVRGACLHEVVAIEFEQVQSIPRIGRGKQPYVISKAGKGGRLP